MDKLEKAMARMVDAYNRQGVCEVCGGRLKFQGCGEYVCESCGDVTYDDYGKVRSYVETHANASVADTAEATGVTQESIRMMIRERKIRMGGAACKRKPANTRIKRARDVGNVLRSLAQRGKNDYNISDTG